MGAITINGRRCNTIGLTLPRYGPWSADLGLADGEPLKGACTLKINDLEMAGTVYRGGSYSGATSLRVIAGGAGWRKRLPSRGYSHSAGVKKSTVLIDAAREAGEKVNIPSDKVIGVHFTREEAKAEAVLRHLTDGIWYVDNKGITQIAERPTSIIASPFTVVKRDPNKGRFEIATEAIQDWVPGRTFTSPTVPDLQTISLVSLTAGNDGALRLVVLTEGSERERLLADIRNIVRSELAPLTYSGIWEYTIVTGTNKTIDATPSDKRLPALTNCPMLPGLMGEEVTPKPGSLCHVGFINSNPTRPVCIFIEGAPLLAEIKATLTKIGTGARPVAALADLAGPFPIVATGVRLLV